MTTPAGLFPTVEPGGKVVASKAPRGYGAGWYYDSIDGDVVHQNLAESLANVLVGYYHGPYATEAEAEAHPGVAGPPGVPNESVGTQVANVSTGSFLGLVESRSIWIRIVEIAIGGTLILIGISKLLNPEIKDAAKIAKVVAK